MEIKIDSLTDSCTLDLIHTHLAGMAENKWDGITVQIKSLVTMWEKMSK